MTTAQVFRATGIIPVVSDTISTRGLPNSGTITIAHGGDGLTPFIIGDAATNGVTGTMATADTVITPTRSYLYDHFESPNVWIISVPSPLAIAKTAHPGTGVTYMGYVTFTIVLSNGGSADIHGVLLNDTLPLSTTFSHWISQNGASEAAGRITWNGTVPVGGDIAISFAVSQTVGYGEAVTNTAVYRLAPHHDRGRADAQFTVEPEVREFRIHLPFVLRNTG